WNNRVLHMGGGGFDGTLVTGLGGASNQIPTSPTPLALGYVTLGSDSGHETAGGFDGRFALNAESFANFGRLQIKKTHDVAMALVHKRYGTPPKHSYFIGGSQGGHEALIAALFYPADYDGIVSHYPAYDLTLVHSATPSKWPTNQDATQYQEATGTTRYVITRDLTLDPLTFDPGRWATRIAEVSEIWDANSVDLSQFVSKGGKVILTVGSIDHTIT